MTSFVSEIIADPNSSDQKNRSTSQPPGWECILSAEDEGTASGLSRTSAIISAIQLALEYPGIEATENICTTTGMCMDIT